MKTFWKWACATAPRTRLVSTRMYIRSVAGSFYCLSHCAWALRSALDPCFPGSLKEEMCVWAQTEAHQVPSEQQEAALLGGWLNPGTGCPEKLWSLHHTQTSQSLSLDTLDKALTGETGKGWALQVKDLVQQRDTQKNLTYCSSKGKQAFRCMLTKLFIPKL